MAGSISTNPLYGSLRSDVPTQIPFGTAGDISELRDSQEITWDFQNGLIVHTYEVPGSPAEAILDARLGVFQPGNLHPWADANNETRYNHEYLAEQTFKHLVRHDTQGERYSKVTSVYRAQPCPYAYADHLRVNTRSIPEWFSKKTPFRRLTGTITPIQVPQPRAVIVRRYQRVGMTIEELMTSLVKYVGYRNGQPFLGYGVGVWLFEGLEARMLYGRYSATSHSYISGAWELTLFFEADIERSHDLWLPKVGRDFLPVDPGNETDRKNLHERYPIFDEYNGDFAGLVATPQDMLCEPSEPR